MTVRTARRAGGPGRRTRPVRRSSAGMTPVRAGAALGMLVTAGAIYGLAATSAFGYSPAALRIEGAVVTPEAAIRERLALEPGQNIFQIASGPLEAAILEIPAVAGVEVSVGLPDTVVVDVEERRPILVWQVGERAFLADGTGLLFAERVDPVPAAVADLPVVVDERRGSRSLDVARTIEPLDLDAASRLASLTPAQLGSAAGGLRVGLTDENGFVVRSVPEGWTAVFGKYVHGLRPPELIPGQVLALTKLFAEVGETRIETAILADDRNGTYIPRATPKPSPTPKP
jgi:cell division septal protein FtsQ